MSEYTLQSWVATVCASTDLDPALVDVTAVLDLARDAAHGIARPAAPLTTFMAGVLLGRAVAGHTGAGVPDAAGLGRRVLADVAALVPPAQA